MFLALLLLFGSLCPIGELDAEGVYKDNLEFIIGDVKQGQIQNRLKTKEQVDNVLDGLERLGCNGVRITIFPEGHNPNIEMFDYLYVEARKRGFKIFANPAQHAGAQRLASRDIENFKAPSQIPRAVQVLVDRVIDFSKEYPCDWINPFNEDGSVSRPWSADQINEIYSKLFNNLNGADLVGPCTWGIPAGIKILQDTDIRKYVTVATTHNLGFNHSNWKEFIALSEEFNLPVWDSEVNINMKHPGRPHRLQAALREKIEGLVLYHAWVSFVNRDTGMLTRDGKYTRERILKDPSITDQDYGNYSPMEGDLIFQCLDKGSFSNIVERRENSPYTHCGIVVRQGSGWMVLEAANKVQQTPIQDWIARGENQSYSVYRLRKKFQGYVPKMLQEAKKFMGRPIDHEYKMDDSRIYAAELVQKAYYLASGRQLAELARLRDFDWGDFEPEINQSDSSFDPDRKVIPALNLSKSDDLNRVYVSLRAI